MGLWRSRSVLDYKVRRDDMLPIWTDTPLLYSNTPKYMDNNIHVTHWLFIDGIYTEKNIASYILPLYLVFLFTHVG